MRTIIISKKPGDAGIIFPAITGNIYEYITIIIISVDIKAVIKCSLPLCNILKHALTIPSPGKSFSRLILDTIAKERIPHDIIT
ncbi:MAG: hypothetical protein U5O15_06130 [Candidatus Krumholzibacteriota bacterium]|nr:hypothetical protein [Candidatus Krumholzibacteriota bacterium]